MTRKAENPAQTRLAKQSPPASRIERRRAQTRSAILSAGQHLFASRAVESVSIDEIVAQADVAKGSFYNHFADKEQLANEISALVQGDCEFHIFSANRDIPDPAARVVRALCVMIDYAFTHPHRTRALLSLSSRNTLAQAPLNKGVSGDIREGIGSGRFTRITLESGVVTVIGLIRIAVHHTLSTGARDTAPALAELIGAALLRALGVAPGDAERVARSATGDLMHSESGA